MFRFKRRLTAALCFGLLVQSLPVPAPARPTGRPPVLLNPYKTVKPQRVTLSDGRIVEIDRYGFASVTNARGHVFERRMLPASVVPTAPAGSNAYRKQTAALGSFLGLFNGSHSDIYARDAVVVVFKDGIGPSTDTVTVAQTTLKSMRSAKTAIQRQQLAPLYTNDYAINGAFAKAGVSSVRRMLGAFDRSRLSSMHAAAQSALGHSLLNVGNAYRVQVTAATVEKTLASLRKLTGVAYAGPDWTISTMHTQPVPLPEREQQALRNANVGRLRQAARLSDAASAAASNMPQNFGVVSSLQSMLNSSNLDAMAAYDEVLGAFHQLPGTGEIVTNVSVGDIYSAEDVNPSPSLIGDCAPVNNFYGPMTQMINGQRYLNYPGMPLIPASAADSSGHIDPHYTSCNEGDPGEYDLDFSMMAPLPDDHQRSNEQSNADFGDLLGIAPGASYRLLVPATNAGGGGAFESSIAGVFLAAATQTPKPDVITASLGYGYDGYGFPGRYLEDDPFIQALISTIVNSMNIVVCISANDGLRAFVPASVGMYGGSAPTNVTSDVTATTQLNDLYFSSAPSLDQDSGAIDVGGTTLNDIFSRPPQDPANAAFSSQLAYPETRYNGIEGMSSGFGSRVNISAPADNVIAIMKSAGCSYDCVSVVSTGGTSASAPEVAAAAAVALQIARLTGHPFTSPRAVRDFLVKTAVPVAQPAQADVPLNVGPQLNVRQMVEQLLANGGVSVKPAVKRVGIAQRRPVEPLLFENTVYFTNTDPTYVNMAGVDYGNGPDGSGNNAFLTFAPDWEGMPAGTSYSLTIQGKPDVVLATTPFARLLPAQVLNAAFPGTSPASSAARTVHLTYRAGSGKHMLAQANFDVTFGASSDATSEVGLAPIVPGVASGSSFNVTYDVTKTRHMDNPVLVVSEPGRFTPANLFVMHLVYAQPLASKSGTVSVPISALQGAGLYGVAIMSTDPVSQYQFTTNWATLRVQSGSVLRPPAPVAKIHGDVGPFYHTTQLPMDSTLDISWDVSTVSGSTGALLEVSAAGPTASKTYSMFNNQNGSIPDNDGFNTGSTKVTPLSGTSGTVTLTSAQLGLRDGMLQQIRVIPVSGQSATGEASDVSSIVTTGVVGANGGELDSLGTPYQGGFALNSNGNDGIMLPWLSGPGYYASEADVFDQTTNATQVALQTGNPLTTFFMSGGGLFNDTGLISLPMSLTNLYGAQSEVFSAVGGYQANGVLPLLPSLALPNANYAVYQASGNNGTGKAALLVFDATQNSMTAPVMLMGLDTTGGNTTLTGPFATNASMNWQTSVLLFDADTNLGKALIVRQSPVDWWGTSAPVNMDVVDMSTGATTTVQSQASGVSSALAIDDTTHVAMMWSSGDNMLVTYNLQTGTQQKVPLGTISALMNQWVPGGISIFTPELIAADPVNHLFLLASPLETSAFNADFNSTSIIYVVDENGTLVKTVDGIAMRSGSLISSNNNNYLQVNGHTRKAYLLSADQLLVFSY